MNQIKPKGTRDFLPNDTFKLAKIEEVLKGMANFYCYKEIRTPIFEHTEVFVRSSGESSDIVNKEMYTFLDKGNRQISLRPEGTAGVIRSFVENKLYANTELPVKLFYYGPMFRYERPQAGRFRQFLQFGIESIGLRSPYIDAQNILFATELLAASGITNFKVKINSIGDIVSRENYKNALKEYFKPYLEELCEDCHVRYEKNPLRILDCKVDGNKELMKNKPSIKDYLSIESKQYFEKVLNLLDQFNVKYEVDYNLVRGLDYYNDTVFEIYATSVNGIDYGAVLAGGRYDNLVKEFGGPDLPAFGFGLGIDRLSELIYETNILDRYEDQLTAYVMPLDKESFEFAYLFSNFLRLNGCDCDLDFEGRSLKSQFKVADKKKALFCILIGVDEASTSTVSIRFNPTKEQVKVPYEKVLGQMQLMLHDYQLAQEHEHDDCCCGHHHDYEDCSHEHDDCCCGHHHDDEHCCHEHDEHEHCHHHEDGEECCCHKKED